MIGSSNYDSLDTWNRMIFKKPLRELDEDDLSRFAGKAITTWGTANDFKHFLPRIFELTAELRTPYEIWIAFDKLRLAEWTRWPDHEQQLIHDYMLALFESIVNDDSQKAEWEFRDYFSAIAHYYPVFEELLKVWEPLKTRASIKHLAEYITDEQTTLFDKKVISGFWDKKENAEAFIHWLLSDRMIAKMQQKFFEYTTDPIVDKISWAEQALTIQRKLRESANS